MREGAGIQNPSRPLRADSSGGGGPTASAEERERSVGSWDEPRTSEARAGRSVHLQEVALRYSNGFTALDQVSLDVGPGEFLTLVGPSGCGKSSLLRLLAGLERPTAGQIEIRPALERKSIGIVFQEATLLPWRSAVSNVALPLELRGVPKSRREAMARERLAEVGLASAVNALPRQLSGGMKMRVALARALVVDPGLLLLDEPFAAVDELTRERLQLWLLDMWEQRRCTTVFVTHSIREAAFLSSSIAVMARSPGRIIAVDRVPLPFPRAEEMRTGPVLNRVVADVSALLRQSGDRRHDRP